MLHPHAHILSRRLHIHVLFTKGWNPAAGVNLRPIRGAFRLACLEEETMRFQEYGLPGQRQSGRQECVLLKVNVTWGKQGLCAPPL